MFTHVDYVVPKGHWVINSTVVLNYKHKYRIVFAPRKQLIMHSKINLH